MGRLEVYRSVVNCNLCLNYDQEDQIRAEEDSEFDSMLKQV